MQQVQPQQGTDTQAADIQVLFHALSSSAIIPVQQLISANPKLVHCKGWNGQTPLHRACLTGDINLVKYLLDIGADPNAINNFNETSLHYASKRGLPNLVHMLVKYGGKLDVHDGAGRLPLHDVAQLGSVILLKYFEECGYNFRDLDNNLQTPLHIVCGFGHLEAFQFLMKKGRSDAKQQDKDGNTPLHICVREGHAHGSWLLVNHLGLSCLYVKNKEGFTPYDIAKQYESSNKEGHKKILVMFEEFIKLPQTSKIPQPWLLWYMLLLGPASIYMMGLIIAQYVLPSYQGIVLFASIAAIIWKSRGTATHRIEHVARWPSPWFIGLFSAGIFHTMLVYYAHIAFYIKDHQGLYIFSIVANIYLLYQYWKLLATDAGVCTKSLINDRTKHPYTVTDLCEAGSSFENYCGMSEIVVAKDTKYCRLCEKCYYRMDHHCLFLMKCVAYNNHTRFVWFLIQVAIIMTVFSIEAFYYVSVVYPSKTTGEIVSTMFWTDGWVFSMMFLNILSILWALFLIRYQMIVVAKAQTSYFQHSISTLTPVEKLMNVITFLQGKPPFATDYKFDAKDMYPKMKSGDAYPKQPGAYPKQPGAYPIQPGAYPKQPGMYPTQQGANSMGHGHSHGDSIHNV